jgi:hypothetical protein
MLIDFLAILCITPVQYICTVWCLTKHRSNFTFTNTENIWPAVEVGPSTARIFETPVSFDLLMRLRYHLISTRVPSADCVLVFTKPWMQHIT